ncbi:AraC-type transcriptional regulator N-terminus [Lentzea xinjiangensis]|uniref:AraC-type transcriptional regulator N-terminus n=1 Tax=Lentzea xinjiangensis TaxID=402600 RepID=A0A1H9W078_9PSEU|nr:AraC family transcriptional regulator [Lentzea xinjiangensis]SES27325.1 AraC-type transcriptional regulator N-terminus [Lentzea xinjiangensis]
MTTIIDDVLVSRTTAGGPPAPSMSGTILAFVAQGRKRIVLGERVYDYRAGQYLVASIDMPITSGRTRWLRSALPYDCAVWSVLAIAGADAVT